MMGRNEKVTSCCRLLGDNQG